MGNISLAKRATILPLRGFLERFLSGSRTWFAPPIARLVVFFLSFNTSTTFADSAIKIGPDHKVHVYQLETVEITGTTRMSSVQLADELGLTPGTPLDDELVMSTRTRLLGLGLFKSVILTMRKGSRPGLAKLVVEVEDDGSVLTDWALGGELGVTVAEGTVPAGETSNTPMDYRLGLIGRNIFGDRHRGSLTLDFTSKGKVAEGQIAYGLPRFAREDTQFDAELAVADPYYRYLDVLGFGARGQGLWTRSIGGLGEVQYGAAMYINKAPRFEMTGFPAAVAGPKVGIFRESRLLGFFPGAGSLAGASLVLAPTQTDLSFIEVDLARTFAFQDLAYWTLETRALALGTSDYALRAETRLDVPLGNADEDQADLFIRLRGGQDHAGKTSLVGSSAMIGIRYHSSGFIAELALKVTRSPAELAPKKIQTKPGATP